MSQDTKKQDLKNLLLAESKLMQKEKWIVEAIQKIKTQRISVQVERMQLLSMMANEEKMTNEAAILTDDDSKSNTNTTDRLQPPSPSMSNFNESQFYGDTSMGELLDKAESSCNTQTLNLDVMNDIDSILTGRFCANAFIEEESSEEEGI